MQRVFLAATGGADAVWMLDGMRLGPAGLPLAWAPLAGSHELQLLARSGGQVLDSVRFQVRGRNAVMKQTREPPGPEANQSRS